MNNNIFKYKYHDVICETCKQILQEVFTAEELPKEIQYDVDWQPALDAMILIVYANGETGKSQISVSYTLDTGTGGLWPKEPSFSDVEIRKTILDKFGNDVDEYVWNSESGEWEPAKTYIH